MASSRRTNEPGGLEVEGSTAGASGGRDLELVPLSFRQAQAFITAHHRHHKPPRGMKFCVGVATDDGTRLVGVATIGRPVARSYDDGYTLEVNRTCTDGTPNANSMLYGAAWRAARALGYRRLITYTEDGESGTSLHAAGYRLIAERPARGSWAASSVILRHLRDADGPGNIQRSLWAACTGRRDCRCGYGYHQGENSPAMNGQL